MIGRMAAAAVVSRPQSLVGLGQLFLSAATKFLLVYVIAVGLLILFRSFCVSLTNYGPLEDTRMCCRLLLLEDYQ